MKRMKLWQGLAVGVAMTGMSMQAQAILIDNGIVGDGFWQVNVLAGGETRTGNLDPVGLAQTEVIFDYFHYVDVGANGGGVQLSDTTISSGPTLEGDGSVTSSGSFLGENGTVSWRTRSSIAPGSSLYLTELIFTSNNPFGTVQLSQYLDEDVLGISDDHLIVVGTPGANDFQLLTIDDNNDVGVSHAATYNTATGMTYAGWAADEFSDLQNDIEGGGASYSIAGVVDTTDLPPIVDARFPGLPAFGPDDITSAIAFDLDPNATFASVILSLGGSPTGDPTPPPGGGDGDGAIPEPVTGVLGLMGLATLAAAARRRRTA